MIDPLTADEESTRSRWRPLLLILVAAMVAMWGYVLYLAIGPGRQAPPDRLDDPAFAEAAQSRCSAALDLVAQLPTATETDSTAKRAEVVREANHHFDAMLSDLTDLAPDGEDGEIVTEWIADWRVYLSDREEYADAVVSDPEAHLLVSAKDNEQITEYIDAFAQDNHMPSCGTPIDL